eukprot:CAMPEP_0185618746 /NCGR_PEP_ID=MMETSP0436-20130131/48098_1 /TAXON_ID=626734 ORGANISM="Favella taraikaensis, Strain Fe Narragansett Bay" /NCGR_SAMPLE_ID=MMETSP0436 /ASSEMBLY_ACC=CAM_ASM_000390 /LENGTH=40 /DNA_ID= /DNA_START= /DNA_END= /DNA_ORIENTATION=
MAVCDVASLERLLGIDARQGGGLLRLRVGARRHRRPLLVD